MTLAQYLKAPGISQSRLKAFARSPAHFKVALDEEADPTRATILGHVFHTAVLEPHLLDKSYYLRPDTYKIRGVGKDEEKKWNGNSLWCKEWLERHKDREVLLSHEHADVIAMRKSVMEHPGASAALAEGASEVCLFVKDPETGILLKCRGDRLTGRSIVDLKSTLDASPAGFAKAILKFGYYVQAAFNLDLANWLNLGKDHFCFIATEKEPPYATAFYELDEASIIKGREQYRYWLSLLSYCMEYDEWPAYNPAIQEISLPDYALRREVGSLLLRDSETNGLQLEEG